MLDDTRVKGRRALRDGLERRDDALGVFALAAVFGPRHVVVIPLEADLVSFAEFRDGRGVVALEVRESLDRLLRVAILARLLVGLVRDEPVKRRGS